MTKSTSPSRSTPRSLARTNTRRTSAASKRDSSNYKDLLTESPDHAIGRSRGGLSTKTPQLVDGHGLPLVTICTAGQDGDSPMFIPLLDQLRVGRRTRQVPWCGVMGLTPIPGQVVGWSCPASSIWQDFFSFEVGDGGVGQAQVHLHRPVPGDRFVGADGVVLDPVV